MMDDVKLLLHGRHKRALSKRYYLVLGTSYAIIKSWQMMYDVKLLLIVAARLGTVTLWM
jgi:hypothetical protein